MYLKINSKYQNLLVLKNNKMFTTCLSLNIWDGRRIETVPVQEMFTIYKVDQGYPLKNLGSNFF